MINVTPVITRALRGVEWDGGCTPAGPLPFSCVFPNNQETGHIKYRTSGRLATAGNVVSYL